LPVEDLSIEEQITKIIKEYSAVKKIGRVITFQLQDIFKVDIDCSFDGNLSIEMVHDIVSEIEYKIKNKIKNAELRYIQNQVNMINHEAVGFLKQDPNLARIIEFVGDYQIKKRNNQFAVLVESII